MFLRFMPTNSIELRRKTARASRVRSTIVPVVGGAVARGLTTTRSYLYGPNQSPL